MSANGDPALIALLHDEIRAHGPITFARFMALALYHPTHGYYQKAVRVGREGDYLTAPEAHPIFGWTLARQLDDCWQLLGRPEPFVLREYGPGPGTLIHSLIEGLDRIGTPLSQRLWYQPVEPSAAHRAALEERLTAHGLGQRLLDATAQPITGVVLANEVLDALPFHRVSWHDGQLWEQYVDWQEGRLVAVEGPPSTPALAETLRALGVTLAEGQTTEICLALADWVAEVAKALERGYVLVLDYGYPVPERYDPQRFPHGTLKTYRAHTVSDDPLTAVGEQDITAHVDFSLLAHYAHQHGLTVLGLTTQAEFLAQAGLGDILVALQHEPGMTAHQYLAARAAAFHLLDPAGLGRFRVMILGKNVPPTPPRGLGQRLLCGVAPSH